MLRPYFLPAHGRFCEAGRPHPASPPLSSVACEVGRPDSAAGGRGGLLCRQSPRPGRPSALTARGCAGSRAPLRGLGLWGGRLVPSAPLPVVLLGKAGCPGVLKVTSAPPLPLTEGPLGSWVAADKEDSLETIILGEEGRREGASRTEGGHDLGIWEWVCSVFFLKVSVCFENSDCRYFVPCRKLSFCSLFGVWEMSPHFLAIHS